MYTHVSKCKNDKIKGEKIEKKLIYISKRKKINKKHFPFHDKW
jgi:hypothetical protein